MGRGKKQLRRARLWLDVSIVGIQFPVAIAIGYFFGHWLDGLLNSDPWLTIGFTFCGIAAGFVNLFRITAQAERAEKELDELESADNEKTADESGDSG
jgi:F0F1-type ATP synthase assembly protein I